MIEEVIKQFGDNGGLLGLVILGVFAIVGFILAILQKKIDALPLQIEEVKADIMLQIEKTKSCVLRTFYEANPSVDRRKYSRHNNPDSESSPEDHF